MVRLGTFGKQPFDAVKGEERWTTVKTREEVSVKIKAQADGEPVFSAVWFDARVATDRDARLVRVLEVKAPRTKLPGSSPRQEQAQPHCSGAADGRSFQGPRDAGGWRR